MTTGSPRADHLPDPIERLSLEAPIADREHLVDDEHVGAHVGGDREAEAGVHAARIPLHGCVDELGELRERDDVVEAGGDLLARHPHDAALEKDVLGAGQVLVKASRNLDERANTPANPAAPLRRAQNAGQQLQDCRLACAVRPDDPERLAGPDRERDVLHRPELALFDRVAALTAEQPSTPEPEPCPGGCRETRRGETSSRRAGIQSVLPLDLTRIRQTSTRPGGTAGDRPARQRSPRPPLYARYHGDHASTAPCRPCTTSVSSRL